MRLLASGLIVLAGSCFVFGQAHETIYSPTRSIKDQGLIVFGWGSGRLAETNEMSSEGAFSLRVQTNNFFQGGVLQFVNPKNLASAFASPTQLFTLKFYIADSALTLGPKPPSAAPPAPGGAGEAAPPTTPASTNKVVPLRTIRLIVTTSDQLKSEVYIPLQSASGTGWKSIAIPLRAITGFDRTNKTVKSIAFSGDAASIFYLGAIEMVDDVVPITGELNVQKLDLALGDEVPLIATAYGGATVLKYEWDFDASDGIQAEAEGQGVRRKFRKPGKYVVTCTVSDQFGLKKPLVLTLNVKVNE